MLDVEWSVAEVAEVTLVEVTVHNPTAVDRRVRVENRVDGPVLPPRTDGVPEAGWDADGYVGVVPGDGRLRLGYAVPSPPVEPPVAIDDRGRADGTGEDGDGSGADAAAAARLLGDAAPPADALPSLADGAGGRGRDGVATGTDSDVSTATDREVSESVGGSQSTDGNRTNGSVAERRGRNRASTAADETDGSDGADEDDAADGSDEADAVAAGTTAPEGEFPTPVAGWLADVERRVDHAERLTGASVVEAATVLDERGGLSAVEPLPDRLADDEAALRALAERASTLADRAAGSDVPVAALRRLS